ncbi:hypothetical protein F5X98DRAFT_371267 [Xylaria grammica]|nr:hypothetical protein F5X98DRAFT_371267 [Xylaria grammica]
MVRRFLPDRSPRRYGMRRRDHDEPDDEFHGINIIDCGYSDFYEPISDMVPPQSSSPLALGQRQKEEDEEQAPNDRGSTSRRDMPASSRPRRECTPSTYPPMGQSRIVQVGEGTTVAGQSSDDFARKPRISLCYQCCTQISLDTLLSTREESCGESSCCRTSEAKLPFMKMPPHAAKACEDFRTFLIWWMEKVDCGADASIERRARDRVQEMRDEIPGNSPITWVRF